MSLTLSTSNGNRVATLVRSAVIAKMDKTLEDATHKIWEDLEDGTTFASATTAQKLAQLEGAIVEYVKNLAKTYNTDTDLAAAKVAADVENASDYGF